MTKKSILILGVSILVACGITAYAFFALPQPKSQMYAATSAQVLDLTQSISADGTVTAGTEIDLGFQTGGTIASIPVSIGQQVHAGDLIASLSDEATHASLLGAEASLQEAQANLADNQTNTQIAYTNAQKSALAAVADAYTNVQNAVVQNLNTLFSNPQSGNPMLLIQTQAYTQERQLETEQVVVMQTLQNWKAALQSASSTSAETLISTVQNYLNTINNFSAGLSAAVNQFSASASSVSQPVAASDLATVNTADTSIANALAEVTTAANALSSATPQSIAALQAKVAEAQATVADWQAQYDQSRLTAPIDGTITEQNGNVGEAISANTSFIHLISNPPYQITTYVSESSVASITKGQDANVTLEAYGTSVVFPATVISVDPGQTIINGVPMYKITLEFSQNDPRIKDGMNATANIIVAEKPGVVAVPASAILNNNGSTSVLVISSTGKGSETAISQAVETGITGSIASSTSSWVEIVSGLQAGQEVATFGAGN
jgi:HlyD family secretion protein